MPPFIYGLADPRNGVIRYIGKAANPKARWYIHLWSANTKQLDYPISRWIRKLGKDGLEPTLLIIKDVTPETWEVEERAHIARFLAEGNKLLNLAPGGGGIDLLRTAKWRQRISESLKGRVISQESRDKASATLRAQHPTCSKGHDWTDENTIWVTKNGRKYRRCRTCKNENQNRARAPKLKGRQKPTCRYGHPLSGPNLRLLERPATDGRAARTERICRLCVRNRNGECKRRKRQRAKRMR